MVEGIPITGSMNGQIKLNITLMAQGGLVFEMRKKIGMKIQIQEILRDQEITTIPGTMVQIILLSLEIVTN